MFEGYFGILIFTTKTDAHFQRQPNDEQLTDEEITKVVVTERHVIHV